jgi:hypothetical protein
MKLSQYVFNNLIGWDQSLNTLLGGEPDETISARCYRLRYRSIMWRKLCCCINLLFCDRNHCRDAHTSELLRSQLPIEYRVGKKHVTK